MAANYIDKEDHHRHQCRKCGHVWEHVDDCSVVNAHKCPGCGVWETEKYFGTLPPTPPGARGVTTKIIKRGFI